MVLKEQLSQHPLYPPGTYIEKDSVDISQIPDRKKAIPEEEIRTILRDLCEISNDRVSFNYWPRPGTELTINLPPLEISAEKRERLQTILEIYDFKVDESADPKVEYHTSRYSREKIVARRDNQRAS
jgi:hypothetical protein